jgi:acetolactate synthase I/II/III large subunit
VAQALAAAGVTRVFGVPGESFLGLLDALHDGPVRFVSTRHEGGAAFMASGYARTAGEIAACAGTRAVGAANMAIGIHNALQDSLAMVALAGQVVRPFREREALQELRLADAFSQWCKWTVELDSGSRATELMRRAIDVARSGRPGPVLVGMPQDVLLEPAGPQPEGEWRAPARPHPDPGALERVLEALATAERPLIVAGGGLPSTEQAAAALVHLAEALEVPVISGWRRHSVFPNDHRLYLGSASIGTPSTVWARIAASDVILAIGTRFHEKATQGYTLPSPRSRLMQIDVEPGSMTGRLSPEIAIQGDAEISVAALLELASSRPAGGPSRRETNDRDRAELVKASELPPSPEPDSAVAYEEVMRAVSALLPPEAIVVTDAGDFYLWFARHYCFRRPGTYLGPTSGAMGYALPAAIGAKLGRPSAPVVAVAGDGGFAMTLQELETAVRHEVPVVALVLDNQRHGTIRAHQEAAFPGREVGTELGPIDFAKVAEGFGCLGLRVTEGADLAPALEQALHAGRPAVVHALMDRGRIRPLDQWETAAAASSDTSLSS